MSNSLPLDEIITDNFNHDENKETPTIDYGGVKESQDALDGIPEEEVHNKPSGVNQNGKLSARSHSSNLNSWSNPEGVNSSGRHRGCDRVILFAVSLFCSVTFADLVDAIWHSCTSELRQLQRNRYLQLFPVYDVIPKRKL